MKYQCALGKSITHTSNRALLQNALKKGVLSIGDMSDSKFISRNAHFLNAAAGMPNMITTPNINAPLGALNYIRPESVDILTAAQLADQVAKPMKNGNFGDDTVTIKVKEYTGTVSPDDGRTDSIASNTNYSNILRGIFYFAATWDSNDRAESASSLFKEDYRADQAKAAMENLAIWRNNYFFSGVEYKGLNQPVYGLLNEPSLPPYQVAPNGASGSSAWINKTAEEIFNDFVIAQNQVAHTAPGLASYGVSNGRGRWKAVISSNLEGLVNKANQYGMSAAKQLRETFGDKLELLFVPQLNAAQDNGDVMYMIYDPNDKPTIINSYVEMARAYPIDIHGSSIWQKISSATSGCIVQYPLFISRISGLSAPGN